jgi:uncharacterized membrane protein
MKKTYILLLFLILVNFISAVLLYPYAPEKMASHWNINGEANGYMTRFWGLFFTPILTLVIIIFLLYLPRTDPMNNFRKFNSQYEQIIIVLSAFMTYIYALTLLWNFGIKFSFNMALAPAFGILFYFIGLAIGKAKQNWFMGIRTPWTLSNAKVWDKTHKLGSELYRVCGFICILGIFFEKYALYFMILPIISVSIFLVVYSYLEWKKLKKTK